MGKSKFKDLIDELGVDEKLTKPVKKEKVFTHVKDNIPLKKHYNYMADLLHLPTDKKGNKFLLVVVDLASDMFDIEPLKNKEPSSVLEALKKMYKREYIKEPYASIKTDGGSEFQGIFQKYLYDESIYHSVARAGRHRQLSNVESLNKQLGRLFNGYMNKQEEKTKKPFTNWTDIIPTVRSKLNAIRKKSEEWLKKYEPPKDDLKAVNKFKVGDIVNVKLEIPESALGKKQSTSNFRMGDYRFDTTPRKITKVLYFSGKIPFRYLVSGLPKVSFTEKELMGAEEEEEEYEVKKILNKKKVKGKTLYLVWWKGYVKKDATWEPRKELLRSVPEMVKEYDENE